MTRDRFCQILNNYWLHFARSWNVLLHESPIQDLYGGIKLAAAGELGIGVGEEENGSGEREALEGMIRGLDGLVDMTASRFQCPMAASENRLEYTPWLGSFQAPGVDDGMVFTGIGNLTRSSLRALSLWSHEVFVYGAGAYGVRDNPVSGRRMQLRRRRRMARTDNTASSPHSDLHRSNLDGPTQDQVEPHARGQLPHQRSSIPPPLVTPTRSTGSPSPEVVTQEGPSAAGPANQSGAESTERGPESWTQYLTFGYGSKFNTFGTLYPSHPSSQGSSSGMRSGRSRAAQSKSVSIETSASSAKFDDFMAPGFLIGWAGDLSREADDSEDDEASWDHRLLLRTLHVELSDPSDESRKTSGDVSSDEGMQSSGKGSATWSRWKRLRVLIYTVSKYMVLFNCKTSS